MTNGASTQESKKATRGGIVAFVKLTPYCGRHILVRLIGDGE